MTFVFPRVEHRVSRVAGRQQSRQTTQFNNIVDTYIH